MKKTRERPKARIVTLVMTLAIVYSRVLLEQKIREASRVDRISKP